MVRATGIDRHGLTPNVVITHEKIVGLLPARTTSFRFADSVDRDKAHPGDPIRFLLQGTGYQSTVLVRMEAW